MVYNHQVITYVVERILVVPRETHDSISDRMTVLIEHFVPKFLYPSYVAFISG